MDNGGGFLALVCTVAVVFLGVQAIVEFPGWQQVGNGLGLAVLGIGGVLLLWWLFGEAKATGLQLARKTVGRLEEEEGSRRRTLGLAWIVLAAAVVLVVVWLLAVSGGTS